VKRESKKVNKKQAKKQKRKEKKRKGKHNSGFIFKSIEKVVKEKEEDLSPD
jgi:hypothetical protein